MCSAQMTMSPSSRGPSTSVVLVDRERQHVGGLVLAAMLGVELGDPLGVDVLDRDVTVLDARRARAPARSSRSTSGSGGAPATQLVADDLDLEHRRQALYARLRSAGRSSGAERSRERRRRPRRSAGRAGGARRPRPPKRTKSTPSTSRRISLTITSPDVCSRGQVDLRDVARDDHPRPEAQARQEHLHLLGARVLGLVEDHERVVQRAPAHERERRDLDHAALEVPGDLLRVHHVVAARRTAAAGTGRPSPSGRPAGSRGARRPRRRGA